MAYKKCPLCGEKIISGKENMIRHIEKEHENEIPTGQTSGEFLYLSEHGGQPRKCMICKKPTMWNNAANKYNAFCSEKCKWEYVKLARARNKRVYGKENLLGDPEQQKKMLANRSISGKYRHSDGGILTYTGTYEEDFCYMMDSFLNYPSNDIVMPSPHVYEYKYKGEKKFYFPDAFIPSLNLEIEIKDGGNNPNMHHKIQDVDKVKEHLKDEAMMKQKDFHYIKIENKDYDSFFNLVEKLASDELSDMERIRKIKIIPQQKTATYEQVEDIFLEAANRHTEKDIEDCNIICTTLNEYEKKQVNGIEDKNIVFMKVIHKDDIPVGFIVLKEPMDKDKDPRVKDCYVILAVASNARGKGIGTILVKEAIHWFKTSDFDQVCWPCDKNNDASNGLAKKCGFTFGWPKDNGKSNVWIITNPSKLSTIGESFMPTYEGVFMDYLDIIFRKSENHNLKSMTINGTDVLEYDFQKFTSGSTNLLFVTGLSGSGKSTLASYLANKYDAHHIRLDSLQHSIFGSKYDTDTDKELEPLIVLFKESDKFKNENIRTRDFWSLVIYRCGQFIQFCRKLGEKFIFEGIQIPYLYAQESNNMKDGAFLFVDTSFIKSFMQRFQRDGLKYEKTPIDMIHLLKMYLDNYREINEMKNKF